MNNNNSGQVFKNITSGLSGTSTADPKNLISNPEQTKKLFQGKEERKEFYEGSIGGKVGGKGGKLLSFFPGLIVSNVKSCLGQCGQDEKSVREDAKNGQIMQTGERVGAGIGWATELGVRVIKDASTGGMTP